MKREKLFNSSEEYWQSKASMFSTLYTTQNPFRRFGRRFLEHRQDLILRMINGDRANLAIDVGCGSGEFTSVLAERYNSVVGFDYSEMMLKMAQDRYRRDNLSFKKSDCAVLPLGNGEVDRLFALGLLDYVNDLDAVLLEFYRVLNPNGFALVTIPKTPSLFAPMRWSSSFRNMFFKLPPVINILSEKQFTATCKSKGFEILELKSLWTTMWIAKLTKA